MRILALSTSGARGSVALLQDEQLLASRHYIDERRHAERIFDELNALLDEAGLTRNQLDVVACDIGPGSFTGTRVGLASAKGIALGLNIPLWPASSLPSMALAAFNEADVEANALACCLDAKRNEIFVACYTRDLTEQQPPLQLPRKELYDWLKKLPAGTACCGAVLDDVLPEMPADSENGAPIHIKITSCALPDAYWLGRLAHLQYARTAPPPLALIEPIYVRAPDAVPNLPAPLLTTK